VEHKIRTEPEEWACTKFCRISLDDDSVADFLLWLCDHSRVQVSARMAARKEDEPVWYDPSEDAWGFDAPRQRMAKLLWQALHGNASDEEFYNRFHFSEALQTSGCVQVLSPIQTRLKWVMEGLYSRGSEEAKIGQSDWGERWWLPPDQSKFVREQLRYAHAELIEQSSNYEDSVSISLSFYARFTVQAIPVPSKDPRRIYVGTRHGPNGRTFVWVQDAKGNKYPLRHTDNPYREADGTGFTWGYGGHGPGALTRCLLTDALDGDLALADELDRMKDGFFEKFILHSPRDKNLKIPRAAILRWPKTTGKFEIYQERLESVAAKLAEHEGEVEERKELLTRIQETGGLLSQRFDIVPTTFESALYLDLMHMLERGGTALRCSYCGCLSLMIIPAARTSSVPDQRKGYQSIIPNALPTLGASERKPVGRGAQNHRSSGNPRKSVPANTESCPKGTIVPRKMMPSHAFEH
jgi:hypothetical protein